MRIIRSRFANVTHNGVQVHTGVRVIQDNQNRIAVFAPKSLDGPLAVYALADITLQTVSAPGCMCKEPSQQQLGRVWAKSESINA